jgi:hypothetical protein
LQTIVIISLIPSQTQSYQNEHQIGKRRPGRRTAQNRICSRHRYRKCSNHHKSSLICALPLLHIPTLVLFCFGAFFSLAALAPILNATFGVHFCFFDTGSFFFYSQENGKEESSMDVETNGSAVDNSSTETPLKRDIVSKIFGDFWCFYSNLVQEINLFVFSRKPLTKHQNRPKSVVLPIRF